MARNEVILNRPLGAGVWLWKPHIVLHALRHEMSGDDVLFYADSGCHFVGPVKPVVDICLEQTSKPLVMFHLGPSFTNAKYTKRDCFIYMDLDRPPYPEMPQILASFFLCRKNEFTIAFFEEWLRYAEDQRLLTEAANTCGLPNYPDFVGHRFDQSILSLLARKYGVTAVPDISQWGNELRQADIPQIIDHTRWKE